MGAARFYYIFRLSREKKNDYDYLYLGEAKRGKRKPQVTVNEMIKIMNYDTSWYTLYIYLEIRAFMEFNNDKVEDGWCIYGLCVIVRWQMSM